MTSTVETGQTGDAGVPLSSSGASAPLVGRLLCEKWRVQRLIGTGGMSVVYEATHRNGNRVAIKVLRPEFAANPAMRTRFTREGYIANRVGHAGAATVLDDGSEDGLFFLVMELVEGESLEAFCQRSGGTLSALTVVELAEQLLEVVAAAHANNVVHRDIKPSNVFVTGEGRVKLLDFGIATIQDGGSISQTNSQALLGTPAFMSPEQARGRHREVDARSDIWAVGATMFRLLSGRLVHVRSTAHETMIATATEAAPALAAVCAAVPSGLSRVVDTALRLDPTERFQNAAAMRAALRLIDRADLAKGAGAPLAGSGFAHGFKARPHRLIFALALLTALAAIIVIRARQVATPTAQPPLPRALVTETAVVAAPASPAPVTFNAPAPEAPAIPHAPPKSPGERLRSTSGPRSRAPAAKPVAAPAVSSAAPSSSPSAEASTASPPELGERAALVAPPSSSALDVGRILENRR